MTRMCVLFCFLLLVGCSDSNSDTPESTEYYPSLDKRSWIEKASRRLRLGAEPPPEDMSRLLDMSRAEIIDEFMQDARFIEMVLDFNLYFLGFKSDKISYPDISIPSLITQFQGAFVVDFFHAITGAKEIARGGDYFKMFEYQQPTYARPLSLLFNNRTLKLYKDQDARRREMLDKLIQSINTISQKLTNNPEMDSQEFCELSIEVEIYELRALLPQAIASKLRGNFYRLFKDCTIIPDPRKFEQQLLKLSEEIQHTYNETLALSPTRYHPQFVEEIKTIDLSRYGIDSLNHQRNLGWFWRSLPNSSTNYNRKRASYVLKRFFCDDLTPLNVIRPKEHAEVNPNRHASDPGCQSCHYKLDPIGGFFRYHGVFGNSFQGSKVITFDDFASMETTEYLREWQNPEGSKRKWKIGFIRSLTDESKNTYPDSEDPTIEDLFTLIRNSNETKRCLVKNIVRYFWGEDQIADPKYLEHLTTNFVERSEYNSTVAFKETVARVLLSQTFATEDPDPRVCYDRVGNLENAQPCVIASTLQDNCTQCHSSQGASGGLDLTSWEELEPGVFGFRHMDQAGKQKSWRESFALIQERLNTTNEVLRMPLNKTMPQEDLETLYLWIEKRLAD